MRWLYAVMFLVLLTTVSAKSLNYCCPVGLDEQLLYDHFYEEAQAILWTNGVECSYDAKKMPCDMAYQEYATDNQEWTTKSLTRAFEVCEENYDILLDNLEERIDMSCGYTNYISPDYPDGRETYYPDDFNTYNYTCNKDFTDKIPELANMLELQETAKTMCTFESQNKAKYASCMNPYLNCRDSCDKNFDESVCADAYSDECATKRNAYWDCQEECQEPDMVECMSEFSDQYCWVTETLYYAEQLYMKCKGFYDVTEDFYADFISEGIIQYPTDQPKKEIAVTQKCQDGYYLAESGNCEKLKTTTRGQLELNVDQSKFVYGKDEYISGQITYSCKDTPSMCEGRAAAIEYTTTVAGGSLNFKIEYDTEQFLSPSNPIVKFKMYPGFVDISAQDSVDVEIYEPSQPDKTHTVKFSVKGIGSLSVNQLTPSPVAEQTLARFRLELDAPEQDYVYTFASMPGSRFHINNEFYEHVAIYSTRENRFEFAWESPQLSEQVVLGDIYMLAAGKTVAKGTATVAEALVFGKVAKSYSNAMKTRGYAIPDAPMELYMNGVSGASKAQGYWSSFEGFVSSTILAAGGTVGTTAAVGTDVLNGWYDAIRQTEKVAASANVESNVPIRIYINAGTQVYDDQVSVKVRHLEERVK